MRKIRFRGKRIDNGRWVYGFLLCRETEDGEICDATIAPPLDYLSYQVDHRTVGQFTGLKDKNGKEIYDGDILRTDYGLDVATMERFPKFWLKKESFGYKGEKTQYPEMCEVIGNIHENPEILEE